MKFVLSPAAQADLTDIWDYTVETWGVEQAVATDLRGAIRTATVAIRGVPVVTFLSNVDGTIAAERQQAEGRTAISVDIVTVVAFLAGIADAVTTERRRTVVQ